MSSPASRAGHALRRRAAEPVTAGFAGKGVELLSQVLLVTALPAALGPADYGTFAVALAAVSVVSASVTVGGPAVMTRFVPAAAPGERDGVARALMVRLGRWRAVQVAAVAVGGAVLAAVAPDTFAPDVMALVVIAVAFDVAATVAFQAALAFGGAALWSFRFPLQNTVLAGAALVLHAVFGTTGAVAGIAVASAAALAVASARVAPRLRRAPRGAAIPPGALRFGLLQGAAGLLTQLQTRGGVLAVALLYGSRVESGFASLAIGVALTPIYAVRQAFTVQLPGLASRHREDEAAAEAAAHRLARGLQPLLIAGALVAALWLDDLLPAVLGEGFSGVDSALGPALALLPLAAPTALGTQLTALRLQPELRLQATVAGTLVFLMVALAAVPSAGAVGATSALLAATALALAVFALRLPGLMTRREAALAAAAVALTIVLAQVT
jgi:O-antigen/teichoic acid export membrane protein